MSVQILGLRSFTNAKGETKKYDAFHDKNWRAKSHAELFAKHMALVEQIPEDERWNIFYTLAMCKDGKREFDRLEVAVFDIDNIDTKQFAAYHDPVLGALGLSWGQCAVIFSGGGLHYVVALKTPVTDKKTLHDLKPHYKAVLDKIKAACDQAGLPYKPDPTVWDARRILRMPGTMNRKAGRTEVMAKLLCGELPQVGFDLRAVSGLPDVAPDDQVSEKFLSKYPKVDSAAVQAGCAFLGWAKENPAKVDEPQWYAELSILARLDDGETLCHEVSQGHPKYTKEETDLKIKQATEASGPRTCKGIESLWDGCKECPHYGKVASPILIKGEGHLKTADTGFRFYDFAKEKPLGVCYPDLQAHFDSAYHYKVMNSANVCYVWTGKTYEKWDKELVKTFAQTHVFPHPNVKEKSEAVAFIYNAEAMRREPQWFADSTAGWMNFQNGSLDVETLDFYPHSHERGFRHVLPYDYDPRATAPRFDQFMKDITCGNQALAEMLLQYCGYSISNAPYDEHKALVMVGEGANGKSTLMNVLRMIAGRGNYESLTLKDLQGEYNRQLLDGKLFNLAEETPSKALMDSSVFKALVGGGEIQARAPYSGPYTYRNRAKLIFACNELPRSVDTTHGYLRRLLIAPFDAVFGEEQGNLDTDLETKLKAELPGILNAVLAAYHRLKRARGFTKVEASLEKLKEYQSQIDTVKQWLDEKVEIYINGSLGERWTSIEALYANYSKTMRDWNEHVVSKDKFCKTLPKHVPNYDERRVLRGPKVNRQRVLIGVTVAAMDTENRYQDAGNVSDLGTEN